MISDQPATDNAADPPTVFGVSEGEVLRLLTAYVAIRIPHIRAEFLGTVEAWA